MTGGVSALSFFGQSRLEGQMGGLVLSESIEDGQDARWHGGSSRWPCVVVSNRQGAEVPLTLKTLQAVQQSQLISSHMAPARATGPAWAARKDARVRSLGT
jgi:hypothetical protein